MTYKEKRLQEFREKFVTKGVYTDGGMLAGEYETVNTDPSELEAFLAETIEEMKGMIELDLLIKCECEDGGCPNCQRMCKFLDDIGLRDKFGKEEE